MSAQSIECWQQGHRTIRIDQLAEEVPMEILIDHCDGQHWHRQNISVTMRSPGHETDLALGFLLSEGLIQGMTDIDTIEARLETNRQRVIIRLQDAVRVDVKQLSRHLFTSSSCGICSKASLDLVDKQCAVKPKMQEQLPVANLLQMPRTLRAAQATFGLTGGLHASGIFQLDGELLVLREDVGRHNALDKTIGAAMRMGKLPLEDHVLLLSGRASFELIQKAGMAGIPLVAALGAPSSLAVALAETLGICLIGFLREESFNIYCGGKQVSG